MARFILALFGAATLLVSTAHASEARAFEEGSLSGPITRVCPTPVTITAGLSGPFWADSA
ncbi:hypothetical protein [Marinobacter sp.]|uniref:hypothetical protein n=1 Tax=Marinobacter sp. TaxID=50741 RepID=UPI003A8FADD2